MSRAKERLRILAGLGLLLPACLGCIVGLVLPTITTLVGSLLAMDTWPVPGVRFVGLEHYGNIFQDRPFFYILGTTLLVTLVRVLVVALVPPLLALALNKFGRGVRIPVRLLLTVPLALFAPTIAAWAWRGALCPRGFLNDVAKGMSGRAILLTVDGVTTLGLACGVGLVFYMAALRGSGGEPSPWKQARRPLAFSWVIGILATIALTLQSFALEASIDWVLLGPPYHTLASYIYDGAFGYTYLGGAFAAATLVLIGMTALSLIAGLLIVFSGLRLEIMPPARPSNAHQGSGKPRWRKAAVLTLLVLMLLISLGGITAGIIPRLWSVLAFTPPPDVYEALIRNESAGTLWLNTAVPPLLSVLLIQLPIAYLGALGVGAVRPFGKRSELLLLPFTPWLFMTVGSLSVAFFMARITIELPDTWVTLTPPVILSVPMLFILALFFKGQAPRWQAARAEGQPPVRAFLKTLVLPSLPLVALLSCISLLLGMQDSIWQHIASIGHYPIATFNEVFLFLRPPFPWAELTVVSVLFGLPTFVFFFVAFGLLQSLFLDRLGLVPDAAGEGEPAP